MKEFQGDLSPGIDMKQILDARILMKENAHKLRDLPEPKLILRNVTQFGEFFIDFNQKMFYPQTILTEFYN